MRFSGICTTNVCILQTPRTEWVLSWPGQLVIAGCQTYWTTEVSEALEKQDLASYYSTLISQVREWDLINVEYIRNYKYCLSLKLDR